VGVWVGVRMYIHKYTHVCKYVSTQTIWYLAGVHQLHTTSR
jgi:hypothetical protein